jgi:hypothetical protein
MAWPCGVAACSFIALATWAQRLAFRLPNSNVLTECLQRWQVKVAEPLMVLMV